MELGWPQTRLGAAVDPIIVLNDPRGESALVEWLGYEKRGSSDDRTLVVLYRQNISHG